LSENWSVTVAGDITSTPLLVDLDSTIEGLEIIVTAYNEEIKTSYVYIFYSDGSILENWPLVIKNKLVAT